MSTTTFIIKDLQIDETKCNLCFLTSIINKSLNIFFFYYWHILVCNCSIIAKLLFSFFHCPANPFQLFHYKQKQLLDRIQYIHPLNYVCELGGIRSKFVQVGTNAIRRAILDHPTHFWQNLNNPTKKYYACAGYNWYASLAIRE